MIQQKYYHCSRLAFIYDINKHAEFLWTSGQLASLRNEKRGINSVYVRH